MSKLNGDEVLMRYRMRYRKARSRRERSALIDEFMSVVGLRSRPHARRLLSARKKKWEPNRPPGRPKVYSSKLMEEELLSIWRDLDYPSSMHLKASLSWIIPLKELHGYRFDPEVKDLMASASRSTIERILLGRRAYEAEIQAQLPDERDTPCNRLSEAG